MKSHPMSQSRENCGWEYPFTIFNQAVAGAGVPKPGSLGGDGLVGTSGNGVPAGAPVGASTCGVGAGGVNFPVRTISSTCVPSSVSYSSNGSAIIWSLARLDSI